ncbi:MAG: type II secretion system F family protein [Candidatus Thermoplasmatota archaeon]
MMTLTKYQRVCYQWFGGFARKNVSEKLDKMLQSAHMEIRTDAYLSYVMFASILVMIGSLIGMSVFLAILVVVAHVNLSLMIVGVLLSLPGVFGTLTYALLLKIPASRAKARSKNINVHLAYACNFISAMASAGVTPTEIFKSLSKQDIYGEINKEAAWIYRDVTLLGVDLLTAIKKNLERTPSQKFKEFLQGMVVTVTSGGSLRSYFLAKANQYMWENRQAQKQLLETLGIMAESYVTAAVAGILLLLIVIPLMMIISGDFNAMFLYILIFMVVPMVHMGFAVVIKGMCQGA